MPQHGPKGNPHGLKPSKARKRKKPNMGKKKRK